MLYLTIKLHKHSSIYFNIFPSLKIFSSFVCVSIHCIVCCSLCVYLVFIGVARGLQWVQVHPQGRKNWGRNL